jgi:dephospho-CoA kinase
MIVVGLTGSIATGKSTVAQMFKRCGAIVIDADALAREVVKPDKPAWRHIAKTFGKNVLNPDSIINRHALGAIVFRSPAKLRRLERIIHPRVAREQQRLVRRIAIRKPRAIVIYEVPLLFEAGVDKRVDQTIVVMADQKTQIARLKKRNGLTRSGALQRIRAQMPLSKKKDRADYVIDGTLPKSTLLRKVRSLYNRLRALS